MGPAPFGAPASLLMTDLLAYASMLDALPADGGAPVDDWRPARCGEIDLVIRRDGVWVHEGAPITRARLVRLFSRVLKIEDGRYFLVTPAEKLAITVEDAPFVAATMRREGEGAAQRLVFTTNVGEEVTAGRDHAMHFRDGPGGRAPYLHIRRGLDARLSRAAYYDLVAASETRNIDGVDYFGAASDGEFFAFCRADALKSGAGADHLADD